MEVTMANQVPRPSRAPEIIRLRKETRLSATAIARQVGTHVSYVWVVLRRHRIATGGKASATGTGEGPAEARQRVYRDLAEGKRCLKCWLILPCDHGK